MKGLAGRILQTCIVGLKVISRRREILQLQASCGHNAMLDAGACVSDLSRYLARRACTTLTTAGQYRSENDAGVLFMLSLDLIRP